MLYYTRLKFEPKTKSVRTVKEFEDIKAFHLFVKSEWKNFRVVEMPIKLTKSLYNVDPSKIAKKFLAY